MNEKIKSIEKNETYELMDLSKEKKAIGLKWVFKTKYNADGSIQKHKARLVAKEYSQQQGDLDDRKNLHQEQKEATEIFCDNKATIAMTKNPTFHGRTKHIEIRYHFIRDFVASGAIAMKYYGTDEQVADILTKSLPVQKHVHPSPVLDPYQLARDQHACAYNLNVVSTDIVAVQKLWPGGSGSRSRRGGRWVLVMAEEERLLAADLHDLAMGVGVLGEHEGWAGRRTCTSSRTRCAASSVPAAPSATAASSPMRSACTAALRPPLRRPIRFSFLYYRHCCRRLC
ncbi:Retrotransposon protein [Musa troglodytarum]|uniref:Retrotransposon protein n=1 Tax=Musa troglodytarum TaxID=320322 RepID=A0A9E7K8X7_9LILI|nr:Retrotransposon protein [Musa troglodytarum]